ncbi:MAG: xanthine dehydrogenase family protein molybdopterin-binding subunit [Desulfomonile tiedjei]|uniref:Xanthine dehydrogenase family protein molybdopterin-binding subunit n=1 Tax=Desulfomonile tiedjei TaxID=2358 RepID=A0A9D6UYJ1_9BACT|nr:xanthine dehydrogenase family protein molybdopterin-binding subunit [Desulfomonile tiedjei]
MRGRLFDEERRQFLQVSFIAGVGLVVGCSFHKAEASLDAPASPVEKASKPLAPNAWIRISGSGEVTVVVNHSELGQGIFTALAMIAAEELEADWSKVRTEMASMDPVYANPAFGVQATGGSTSVRTCWVALKKAGAATRELLVAAAASTWGVSVRECRAESGKVVHGPSGRSLLYGQLVEKAASMPVPHDVPLKKHRDFKVIGKKMRRLDTELKTQGRAVFGMDVRLKGLLTAVVVHPPVFGARLKSLDHSKAMSMPGVRHVVPISTGVAVVADRFWQAKKAVETLRIEWDQGNKANLGSENIRARWVELAKQRGDRVRDQGDVDIALKKAAKVVEAVYELPFQAHGCPEPMNCTAFVRGDGCDVWVPTQNQGGSHEIAAAITGLDLDRVRVHTTFSGGGFGRRGDVDFVAEAVEVSKAVKVPVKVVWTREEDIRNDHFRPASYHVLRAGLDATGKPVALHYLFVGPSWMDGMIETLAPAIMPRWFPRFLKNAAAHGAVPIAKYFKSAEAASEGASTMAYAMEHIRVEYIKDDPGVPTGAWRSVAHSGHAFVVESFVDEIAMASGNDPFQLRMDLLRNAPKRRKVLKIAAEKSGWEKKPPDGIHRGIAVHDFHDTPAAMVTEVSVDKAGQVRVHRVVCAVDCGTVINPKNVEAQISGAIAFGLTATLKGSITIGKGRAEQSNFDDFPLLRMDEMPKVEVHIVESEAAPTGIGEVGVPPIAPAVANAVFAATGKRIRKLPITSRDLAKG